MGEIVDRELDFVSVFRDARLTAHYSSIGNENVQSIHKLQESIRGRLHGSKRALVALHEGDLNWGIDDIGFANDRFSSFCITASKDYVFWAMLCECGDRLFAQPSGPFKTVSLTLRAEMI